MHVPLPLVHDLFEGVSWILINSIFAKLVIINLVLDFELIFAVNKWVWKNEEVFKCVAIIDNLRFLAHAGKVWEVVRGAVAVAYVPPITEICNFIIIA